MNKTTIVGILIIAIAVLNIAKDVLTGNFTIAGEVHNLYIALNGSGLVFARSAIQKMQDLLTFGKIGK